MAHRMPCALLRSLPFRPMARRTACAVRCLAAPPRDRKLLVQHILIKDKSKTAVLDQLESQLAAGKDFGDLAKEASECGSAKRQGQLGWLARGTYFPEFEEAAFSVPVGGVARASTPMGLHLLRVMDMREVVPVQQMAVQELADVLSNPALSEDVQFVDVREEWEFQTARLPHFKLFPLSKFAEWKGSSGLDPTKETLVLCHHGVRSMQVASFLVSEGGFQDVKNVTGGIHQFSTQVDASVPVY